MIEANFLQNSILLSDKTFFFVKLVLENKGELKPYLNTTTSKLVENTKAFRVNNH